MLNKRRQIHQRGEGGRMRGKPETGAESQHLLGGFVQCGVCGGRMVAQKRTGKRGRPTWFYVCRLRRDRGPEACSASQGVRMVDLHEAVVTGLSSVLDPERLDQLLAALATEWAAQADAHAIQRAGIESDLRTVEGELRNLTAALAAGAAVPTVLDGIKEREARKRDLTGRLAALDADAAIAHKATRAEHLDALRSVCRDWKTLLRADAVRGRRVLRDLRIERVVARRDAEGRWVFRLEGDLSKLSGVEGRDYAVIDEAWARWSEPGDELLPSDDPADEPVGKPVEPVYERVCTRGDSKAITQIGSAGVAWAC
jgi:Recombinase zinc beta ribbon domain